MSVSGQAGCLPDGRVNILFPEHDSATVKNILKVLGKIIELVTAECHMQ